MLSVACKKDAMPSLEHDEPQSEESNDEEGGRREEVTDTTSSVGSHTINTDCGRITDEESLTENCLKKDSSVEQLPKDQEKDKDEEDEEEEDDGLPVDKGWAWVVLAGSVLNLALMIGYIRGLSILFIEYLRVFNASAAKTTLLMGVNAGVYSISALLSMHILVGKIGVRKTTFLGAGLSVVGMSTAISPINIDFIIAIHSVILGIGHAMIFGPGLVIVGQYFRKRRGLASAISMSGVSVGGSIFPPMIRFFLDEYGLQGTMILLTGITMNMFVGASVYIPIEKFKKRPRPKTTSGVTSVGVECTNKPSERLLEPQTRIIISQSSLDSYGKFDKASYFESPLLIRKRLRTESNGSSISKSKRNILLYASQPDFGSVLSIPDAKCVEVEEIEQDEDEMEVAKKSCITNILTALDFSLFKKPMFIFVVGYSFFCVVFSQAGSYLPALSSEKGISKRDAALFLTFLGSLDLVCRLVIGFILDTGIIRVNKLMSSGLLVLGTASHFTRFYNSYASMLVFACINGISTCTYFGVIPVAIIEFMGMEFMAKTLGFVSLFHGISIAIANPIIGGIRDATGSYTGAFHYIGACAYVGAILLLCEPMFKRCAEKTKDKTREFDIESKPLNEAKVAE